MSTLPLKCFLALIIISLVKQSGFGQDGISPYLTLAGHTQSVISISFSPNGKYVVTSSRDKTAKIWEVETGRLIRNLTGHTDVVESASFSPACRKDSIGGKYIVTASRDCSAKIWETATNKLINNLIGNYDYPKSATFSPNGEFVLTVSYVGRGKMWETKTGKLVKDLSEHTGYFLTTTFSPACPDDPIGGRYIITASSDFTAKIWETSNGKLINSLSGHTDVVRSAEFSPDGRSVVTASVDKTAKIWETKSGKVLKDLTGFTNIQMATFSPDGKFVATVDGKSVKIWEITTGKIVKDLQGHALVVNSATFSPDGKYVATASSDRTAKIWEVNLGNYPMMKTTTDNKEGKPVSHVDAANKTGDKVDPKGELNNKALYGKQGGGNNGAGLDLAGWNWDYTPDPNVPNNETGRVVFEIKVDDSGEIISIRTIERSVSLEAENICRKEVEKLTFSKTGKNVPAVSTGRLTFVIRSKSIPKPTSPANLQIESLSFSDKQGNNNNILDAGEKAEVKFKLSNSGNGNAYNIMAEIKVLSVIHGMEYPNITQLGNLDPGSNMIVSIPISAAMSIESGKVEFEVLIKEGNGFDADPIRISLNTQKYKSPLVTIADHKFSTEGGKIRLGQLIALLIIVQNKGQGEARNINIEFLNPIHVFPGGRDNFTIDKLSPNESKKFVYEFFANRVYSEKEIPIEVIVTESQGHYGENRILNVSLEETLPITQILSVEAQTVKTIKIDDISLRSDVDINIPVTGKINKNRFALVIGNEDYKKYQTGLQVDQNVLFARNDAQIFREYLVNTFGIPEKQTFILLDATRAQMNRELERIIELVKLTPNAELIFYYAGHGLPDLQTQQGYLIPVDVTASNLNDALSLKDLYTKLASSKAEKIIVFLDACFSGGGRGENGLLAARTVKIKPKGDIIEGNIVAFTATSGEEVSLPLHKEYHGLFTYHILKILKDTQGQITLEQLKDYLETEVPKASLIENGIRQTPQILVAPDLNNQWLLWKIHN